MNIKTGAELAAACLDVAQNHKTLYVMGCYDHKDKKEYAV